MKKLTLMVAAAALTLPAAATAQDFTGLRVEGTASVVDVTQAPDTSDISYGAAIGVDFPLSESVIAGVEVSTDNAFDNDRTYGAAARLGYVVADDLLAYGKVGYTNYRDAFSRDLDGLRLGAGLEYNISDLTFVKVEGRYSDFENGVGNAGALLGVGLRF